MRFQQYNTVLFDLDGTLLNTLQDLAAAGNHALSALGLPAHPVQDYQNMVGNGIPTLIRRMLPPQHCGPATQAVALQLFQKHYTANMFQYTQPYPGIPQLLAGLRGAGVRLGVLSNKQHNLACSIVEYYFSGIFQAVAGLQPGAAPKPDPASLLALMESLHASPAATLYVGDSDVDVLTAHNAGLPACGVLWGFRTRAELESAGADTLAANPEALGKLIVPSNTANRIIQTG
ncbi:MAG: HAD family hydrolase [Ruminococcaceae bacterium]|nr:HAD family hydrolase [Oscillospiraceae bacterium]